MTNRTRLACTAAALVPLAVLAAACSSAPNSNSGGGSGNTQKSAPMKGAALPTKPDKAAASLTETGSTLLFPLFGTWATAYQKQFIDSSGAPIVTITTGGTGSGTGITDAATGTVNIGASDAYLSSANLQQYPGLLNIALAISAQQVNYNVPGVKNLKLNGTVLAQIYTGKITNWNDPAIKKLNPGVSLPSLKIVPLHRAESSGDTFLFTSYLNAQDPSGWQAANVNTTVSWPSVPAPWRRPATAAWSTAARPTRAASPTSASATCRRRRPPVSAPPRWPTRQGSSCSRPRRDQGRGAALTGKTPANESLR